MPELFPAYDAARSRMLELARNAGPDALGVTVPACPDWTALQLITHCVSMPAALGAGDFPSGDINEWIDKILTDRSDHSLDELAEEWGGANETIAGMVNGGGGMLFDDLAVHEHDLRGALGTPDHSALDASLLVPSSLASCVAALESAGLGSIEVRHGTDVWRSHDAETGWVLEVTPWEAVRVLYSRRTADELRSLGGSDNIDAYIAVLDAHLPLPVSSLGEN
jgi:hypothetical protein